MAIGEVVYPYKISLRILIWMCRKFLYGLWSDQYLYEKEIQNLYWPFYIESTFPMIIIFICPWKCISSIRECNCREAELSIWDISTTWWERKQENKIGDYIGKLLNIDILIFMYMVIIYVVYWCINIHVPGASMWFYSRVLLKDPTVHSTCWYGTVARWAIQNIPGHLPSLNNTISGWFCGKLHPTNTKWNSKSILSLRAGEHNGAYHVSTWER